MIDRDFCALSETAVESRLWRAFAKAGRVWTAAWQESAAARTITRVAEVTGDWTPIDLVRCAAIVVTTMTLGHLGLVALFPAYLAPALPLMFMVAVALLAAAVALMPRGFVHAWNQSRLRQASRRLTGSGQNNDA